jgi:hypothetical protein
MWRFILYCWIAFVSIALLATPFFLVSFIFAPLMWHWVKVGKFD